jgi:hypothetical protein
MRKLTEEERRERKRVRNAAKCEKERMRLAKLESRSRQKLH